ncbi:MAG TPA: hypothetical protein VGB26_00205 [Nitrospiria bacterium]|jgi:DNA polymerase III delta prime subunit
MKNPSSRKDALIHENPIFQNTFAFFDIPFFIQSNSYHLLEFFNTLYKQFISIEKTDLSNGSSYFLFKRKFDSEILQFRINKGKGIPISLKSNPFPMADSFIFNDVVKKVRNYYLIHALSLSFQGKGVIFSGPTGSGKTTLGLELIQRGFQFLSDELAALSRSSHLLFPFPRALCIRKKTIDLFERSNGFYFSPTHPIGDQRWMIDNEDFSKGSTGKPCKPNLIFLLSTQSFSGKGLDNEIPITLELKRKDDQLLSELSELSGVKYLSASLKDGFYYPRFRVRKSRIVQKEFIRICEKYQESVLYRIKAVNQTPNPNADPKLIPISKTVAALELFGNLQNVSFDGLSDFSSPLGTPPQILAGLSAIVAKTQCYRLVVGDLKKTADLVCDLVRR